MADKGKIIDVHAHLTPDRFQRAVLGGRDWHGMTSENGELDNLRNRWGPERRMEEMDALGVDVQVVSPTDCFYQYDRAPKVTARIAAEANEEVAEMARDHPTRFRGLGTLPMQDVERAIMELTRSMRELGLVGVMIDDHVNGLTYDHHVFDEFWAAAEELGAFVLIHQFQPTVVAYRTDKYFLLNSIGNLVDRTISFGTLVYGGVMDKYPDLKICLAHAGGYTPYALDRLDKGWEAWPGLRGRTKDRPSTYARCFYYDTVTFTTRNLRFLIDVIGCDRIVFGTDWPAPMKVEDPVRWIRSAEALTDLERESLLWRTAAGIFDSATVDDSGSRSETFPRRATPG
jgi:aminocarboxymuconate-semialdehyde decarboxylase